VAFAIKGGQHARRLWQYKAVGLGAGPPPGSANAIPAGPALGLLALLLVFLRDHGACLWRAAGMTAPTHIAVVPTARGRPGVHPLRGLIAPYVAIPWAELSARPADRQARDLDPDRFSAAPLPRARVLLVDDTWTTGASAQSAAMALRRSGAVRVVTVVLGRHVAKASGGAAAFWQQPMPFLAGGCAVHPQSRTGQSAP
jgi:hypothetical protein